MNLYSRLFRRLLIIATASAVRASLCARELSNDLFDFFDRKPTGSHYADLATTTCPDASLTKPVRSPLSRNYPLSYSACLKKHARQREDGKRPLEITVDLPSRRSGCRIVRLADVRSPSFCSSSKAEGLTITYDVSPRTADLSS
jgi:hypothetical protein